MCVCECGGWYVVLSSAPGVCMSMYWLVLFLFSSVNFSVFIVVCELVWPKVLNVFVEPGCGK